MPLNRTALACRSRHRHFNEDVWKIMSQATRKCDEKATAVEVLRLGMKSASAKNVPCERPKPSWSSYVSFERRRGEAASSKESDQSQRINRV
jgi:hypothetical protein